MADSIRVFSTGTFHFKLGGPPQSLHLHTELVAKHSPVLASLMTGPMCEAKDGTATIHDVEVDSFTRFAEYIYGGDYNAVQPTVVSEESEKSRIDFAIEEPTVEAPEVYSDPEVPPVLEDVPAAEEPPAENGWWNSPKKSKRKGVRKTTSKPTLPSLADYSVVRPVTEAFPVVLESMPLSPYPVARPVTEAFPVVLEPVPLSPNPVDDSDQLWDFSEVLLCHARVYCMADRFQVPTLKGLAVSKIYVILRQIVSHNNGRLRNLVSLLAYVYGHTFHSESTREPLRDLLAHYVAWDFRARMEEEDFKAFLAENGAFAQDVCEKVSMRL